MSEQVAKTSECLAKKQQVSIQLLDMYTFPGVFPQEKVYLIFKLDVMHAPL